MASPSLRVIDAGLDDDPAAVVVRDAGDLTGRLTMPEQSGGGLQLKKVSA